MKDPRDSMNNISSGAQNAIPCHLKPREDVTRKLGSVRVISHSQKCNKMI